MKQYDQLYDICLQICPCSQCDCDEEDCELAKAYRIQNQEGRAVMTALEIMGQCLGDCEGCEIQEKCEEARSENE